MFLSFGEIMLRVAPPNLMRFRQALPGALDVTFGGGESNVCSSLAILGRPVRYLTALPKHPLADALVGSLRNLGIDTSHIVRRDAGRLGIYFLETGANQRSSQVIYDRAGSAVSRFTNNGDSASGRVVQCSGPLAWVRQTGFAGA